MSSPSLQREPPEVLTVSQLNRRAKSLLESHFDFAWVGGEISNFATPASGHWYFTLKDGNAQVRCAMFRNRNQRLRFTPNQGDEVRVRCRVSLYEGRGEFQLIVEHLEPAGAGALQAAFEQLKAKLQQEGLFDESRKRALPETASALGVITSPSGAAVHDILTVLKRRNPGIAVYLLPVQVQGEGAAQQIADAIRLANRACAEGVVHLDALIVGRGGGSLEDLWAFNEEEVARTIAASELPVVSAVGHEVDFSIADFVADWRAPTPSAAAELLSPNQQEWQQLLLSMEINLAQLLQHRLTRLGVRLQHLRQRLRHPGAQLREQAQRIDDLEQRLLLAQTNSLRRRSAQLALLQSRLHNQSPLPNIAHLTAQTRELQRRLHAAVQQRVQDAGARLAHLAQMLDSLSPLSVLARGFAIVTDSQGNIIKSAAEVTTDDEVSARLAQGELSLKVLEVRKKID